MVKHEGDEAGPLLRLGLFGAMEARSWAGEDVMPRGRKAQAILAYLATCGDAAVPRRRLAKLLWSRRWDEQARASLRQSLMELRRSIADIHPGLLVIEKDRVSLLIAKVWIDGIGPAEQGATSGQFASGGGQSDRFLESLRGLDPEFDDWIAVRAGALANAKPEAADVSIDQGYAAVMDDDAAFAVADRREDHRLTVAVTPFIDLDGEPETVHLSSAFTREVVAALSRFRWFVVRLGSFDASRPSDYRLDGSVSTQGGDLRIALRLLDCRHAEHPVWTHQRDVNRTVLQEFLGSVAERIVEHVDPEILAIETRRARTKPTVDCAAYECLLRALHLIYSFDRINWEAGRTLLEQAIAKDPAFGRAYAVGAVARSTALSQGWIAPTEVEIETLGAYAARAVECDPYDSMALTVSAHTRIRVKRDFAYAMPTYENALRLNPSCGFAWGYSAIAHGYLGHTGEAMRRLERARDLMICDSFGQFLESFDMPIIFCSRDWKQAIALGERFAARGIRVNNMYKLLVGALCHVGRFDEARRYNQGVMKREPGFSWRRFVAGYPFGQEQDRLALAFALSQAGLMDSDQVEATGKASNVVTLHDGSRRDGGYSSRRA